jgi:hypothetical protein
MNKVIDLESIRELVVSAIKENALTDNEINECGVACGCGTTTADLGTAIQYLGDKKKKDESDTDCKEEGNAEEAINSILADIEQKHFEMSESFLTPVDYLIYLGEVGKQLKKIENKFTPADYKELVEILNMFNNFYEPENHKNESALQEDEMEEMARGVIAPQEIAKREYVAEYPNSGIKTADQFLRKVINDPQAEGHDKYVKRLAFLLRNTDVKFFSNIAADISLDDEEDSNDNGLVSQYSNGLLNHRKGMSKASYDSKGTLNAYQRNVVKRGPYRKTLDMIQKPVISLGMEISNKYNEVDPSESNKVLSTFFKSLEWNKLDNNQKLRELNAIENEADLDNIGFNILSKEKNNVLDILAANEE